MGFGMSLLRPAASKFCVSEDQAGVNRRDALFLPEWVSRFVVPEPILSDSNQHFPAALRTARFA